MQQNIVCCESEAGSFLNNLIAELYFNYGASFCVLCFFLALPCVGLQSVSVACPGHLITRRFGKIYVVNRI